MSADTQENGDSEEATAGPDSGDKPGKTTQASVAAPESPAPAPAVGTAIVVAAGSRLPALASTLPDGGSEGALSPAEIRQREARAALARMAASPAPETAASVAAGTGEAAADAPAGSEEGPDALPAHTPEAVQPDTAVETRPSMPGRAGEPAPQHLASGAADLQTEATPEPEEAVAEQPAAAAQETAELESGPATGEPSEEISAAYADTGTSLQPPAAAVPVEVDEDSGSVPVTGGDSAATEKVEAGSDTEAAKPRAKRPRRPRKPRTPAGRSRKSAPASSSETDPDTAKVSPKPAGTARAKETAPAPAGEVAPQAPGKTDQSGGTD